MEITGLIIVAILVEAVWENLKMVWKKGKFNVNRLGSLLLGILVCVLAKQDIFALVGIDLSINVAGYILTGILVSRGANVLNDLIAKIGG